MGFSLLLYNAALLLGLVVLFPLWIGYLLLVPKVRAGFWEKLGFLPISLQQQLAKKPASKKRIWFHAVSVGELNAIKTLIPDLMADYDLVLSTTTLTGHTLAEKLFPQLPVLYFPFDVLWAVCRVLRLVQPDLVVVAETELWPNFIHSVRTAAKPIILINGRLSQRSFKGYMNVKPFIKPSLNQFTHFYMQSQMDANRMKSLGDLSPEQLTVVGNLKFDLSPVIDEVKRAALANLLNIQPDDTVLTFASTHSGEDALLIDAYLQLKKDFPELKMILAPRHPERLPEIRGLLNSRAVSYSVRSQLNENHLNQQELVVLDSIGELMLVYSLSKLAVMGGSFVEKGGQNPLEPISQRVPVILGPSMENFAEISRMILEHEAGYQVNNPESLCQAVTQLLTQPEIYDSIAENGQRLLENNRGAKALVLQAIRNQLIK